MDTITLPAYAKINLSLDILGTLPNGYHEVRMLMQSVSLKDEITLCKITEKKILLSVENTDLPTDSRNLAYRAASAFFETFSVSEGVSVRLKKNIPAAAGLAGGSSDAATVLRGMNLLFGSPASLTDLQKIGLTLGADVPYCLQLGCALAEGIGERLTPLRPAPDCCCLLVKPPQGASTKEIYTAYDAMEKAGLIAHPDTSCLLRAIASGDYGLLTQNLGNVLEPVTSARVSDIQKIEKEMLLLGADAAQMSGSGPTVFGLFSDAAKAQKAYETFLNGPYGDACFLTRWTDTVL